MWPLVVRALYGAVFSFVLLFSLLLSAIIVVNLLRLLPYTRGVWQRIRADWTQLSFMLYGGMVFGVIIAFDEYRHEEPWKLVIWLCLAVGAWGYLRAKKPEAALCGTGVRRQRGDVVGGACHVGADPLPELARGVSGVAFACHPLDPTGQHTG